MATINLFKFANIFQAYLTCKEKGNAEWQDQHDNHINSMLKNLPSGAGIDKGIKFDWANSKPECLIFNLSFHHMNNDGYYDGWTTHTIKLRPSFLEGFSMTISGRNRNEVKTYLVDIFHEIFYVSEFPTC